MGKIYGGGWGGGRGKKEGRLKPPSEFRMFTGDTLMSFIHQEMSAEYKANTC